MNVMSQRRDGIVFAGLAAAVIAAPLIAAVQRAGAFPEGTTAGEVYAASCAACHGADGRGAPPSVVGFEEPLPDFTDCSFATREPDSDWSSVVHRGGPARAFSPMMPAFGDALSPAEIQLALDHLRTFCPDPAWPRGELNLPRAIYTEKAFPEDEAVYTVDVAVEGDGAVDNELVYEHRLGARNQIELVVPFGWVERPAPEDGWTGGLGDVAVGGKRALYHSLERGSIFSVAAEIILPTGDEEAGLGGDHWTFEPFLAFGQILPADSFLHVQGGAELPLESDADDEAFLRLALGKRFKQAGSGRVWAPIVELLGSRELVSGAETHWDAVPEIHVSLSTRQHVLANLGARIPLDDTAERDTRIVAYILWDWFDGGLFEGW